MFSERVSCMMHMRTLTPAALAVGSPRYTLPTHPHYVAIGARNEWHLE